MKKTIKIFACVAMVVTLLLSLSIPCFASALDDYPVEFSLEGYSQESIDRFNDNGVFVSLEGVYYYHSDTQGAMYNQESSVVTISPRSNEGIIVLSFESKYHYSNDSNDIQSESSSIAIGANGILYMYDQIDGAGNYGYVFTGQKLASDALRCDTPETAEKLRALLNPTRMSDLVTNIFESFGIVIGGLTEGLKDSFDELLYVDPAAADPQFSPMILFLFTLAGVSVATGIVYGIFALVKSKRRG